jgi:hypothetical protein
MWLPFPSFARTCCCFLGFLELGSSPSESNEWLVLLRLLGVDVESGIPRLLGSCCWKLPSRHVQVPADDCAGASFARCGRELGEELGRFAFVLSVHGAEAADNPHVQEMHFSNEDDPVAPDYFAICISWKVVLMVSRALALLRTRWSCSG